MIKTHSLAPSILKIVKDKATEPPFSGEYNKVVQAGTYLCRQCGLALFRGESQFHSGCGWPSFDGEIPSAVLRQLDQDEHRVEIVCLRCLAHLGHVFQGEFLTKHNLRHCVNSLSLDFVTDIQVTDTEEVLLAGGCFWGIEYYLNKLPGVLKTEVGFSGGQLDSPSYHAVCRNNTGHYEVVRVLYDPSRITFEDLIKYFFEIHDPTQANGQTPDIGDQYRSAIFCYADAQKNTAENIINTLKNLGYPVETRILPVDIFWRADDYHQSYYVKNNSKPFCHAYTKRFPDLLSTQS